LLAMPSQSAESPLQDAIWHDPSVVLHLAVA
jgi:hypothetical protein